MASFHCSVKVGRKGKASPHSDYISRQGKFAPEKNKKNVEREVLEWTSFGNMPKWAATPRQFWTEADDRERANGSTYREFELALPNELTPEQRRELVEQFVQEITQGRHAYQYGIHLKDSGISKQPQPHVHLMYSERIQDGIERAPDQYFKRANKTNPAKGGCTKAAVVGTFTERAAELQATRKKWADMQNKALEKYGHEARVTHLSLKEQGLEREAEMHLGPNRVKNLTVEQKAEITERRQAEADLEREQVQFQTEKVKEYEEQLEAHIEQRERRAYIPPEPEQREAFKGFKNPEADHTRTTPD